MFGGYNQPKRILDGGVSGVKVIDLNPNYGVVGEKVYGGQLTC